MELKNEGKIFYFGDSSWSFIAKMETTLTDKVLNISHTEVSKEYRGQGAGSELLDALEAYAKEKGYELTATCAYASKQLSEKHNK